MSDYVLYSKIRSLRICVKRIYLPNRKTKKGNTNKIHNNNNNTKNKLASIITIAILKIANKLTYFLSITE